MAHYAYIHCKPDGTPFYVGKGDEARIKKIPRKSNQWHNNIVCKYGKENILVGTMECSSEGIAFELEVGLIKRLRAMGTSLVNMTNGGDGFSGYVLSEEAKEKKRLALIGRPRSEETKQKLRLANLGKKHTEESRRKMSEAQRKKTVSAEVREKISKAHKGKKLSLETRRKISEVAKGRKTFLGKTHSKEARLKISRNQGGLPIECVRGDEVIRFDTLKEACRSLGLNIGRVYYYFRNSNNSETKPIRGWIVRRVKDDG